MEHIFEDIRQERDFQDRKWGSQRHLPALVWAAILGEEVGEVDKAALELFVTNSDFQRQQLREELVQVAAVAVAFIEALDEGGANARLS